MDNKLFWQTGGVISLALVATFIVLVLLGAIPSDKIFLDIAVIIVFIIIILLSARFFVNLFSGSGTQKKK